MSMPSCTDMHIRTRLVDFNGMSTHVRLFYVFSLWNCVNYAFISTFLCKFCSWFYRIRIIFKLIGVSINLGVMPMMGCSTFSKSPELEPHHQMQFSVISRKHLFWKRMSRSRSRRYYPSLRGYSQRILWLADGAIYTYIYITPKVTSGGVMVSKFD